MRNLFNSLARLKRQWDYSTSVVNAAKSGIPINVVSNKIDIVKSKLYRIAETIHQAPPRTREIFTKALLDKTFNCDPSPKTMDDLIIVFADSTVEATEAVKALNDPKETDALRKITETALRLDTWLEKQDARLLPVLDRFIHARGIKDIITSMAAFGTYEITVKGKPKTFNIFPQGPS